MEVTLNHRAVLQHLEFTYVVSDVHAFTDWNTERKSTLVQFKNNAKHIQPTEVKAKTNGKVVYNRQHN